LIGCPVVLLLSQWNDLFDPPGCIQGLTPIVVCGSHPSESLHQLVFLVFYVLNSCIVVSARVVVEDFLAVFSSLYHIVNMEQSLECCHFVTDDLHVGGVGRV
jgi:hypothetical protein